MTTTVAETKQMLQGEAGGDINRAWQRQSQQGIGETCVVRPFYCSENRSSLSDDIRTGFGGGGDGFVASGGGAIVRFITNLFYGRQYSSTRIF